MALTRFCVGLLFCCVLASLLSSCLADTTNLARYTLTVPHVATANATDQLMYATSTAVVAWLQAYCFTTDTVTSKSAPISKPYRTMHIYATSVNANASCTTDFSIPSFSEAGIALSGQVLTTSLDVSTCIANNTLVCDTSPCSTYIQCDTGLYDECIDTEDCQDKNQLLVCHELVESVSYCVVSPASINKPSIVVFFMFAVTILAYYMF